MKPPDQVLWEAMVRRLKTELPPKPDGTPRFPTRRVEALDVDHTAKEREGYALLATYTAPAAPGSAKGTAGEQAQRSS